MELQNAALEAAKEAAAKAAAEEAALIAAAHAAELQNAALEAAKEAASRAAADAAVAREATNAAKVAAELEAANASAAQNAAKANAARDAAKATAARETTSGDSSGVMDMLAKHSIYYPTDIDIVPEQDKLIVYAHAKYLVEHPNTLVRLEGNADERGSSEYNLALGQRRADGVKKMMLVGGVKEGQVESVSYGEEKPVATAHNEAAWSQNRRTDIKYNAK